MIFFCGDTLFKDMYFELFLIATNRDAIAVELMNALMIIFLEPIFESGTRLRVRIFGLIF
jgi:hypothetical protein